MGCGCGRRGKSRADRIKSIKPKKTTKINSATILKTSLSSKDLGSNSTICLSCDESRQSREERKKGIRVCHKVNRLINNIIRDPRFVCPLGKWRNSK